MRQRKSLLYIIIASYVLVLFVNITGNYTYYRSDRDWHFSLTFSLFMTTVCWVVFLALTRFVFNKMTWTNRPTLKIIGGALMFAAVGAGVAALSMKAVVGVHHLQDFGLQQYISTCTYSALFSMIVGLMVTGQQSLINLKGRIEENELMKRQMVESQYESLRNQVNPHFLFNALNTLTAMIPNQPDVAVQFVEQMSKVFRYSLQHRDTNTVDVTTELNVVNSLLFLNTRRFEGKLTATIELNDDTMKRNIITHSLLMVVENAIKHNEISTQRPLTISITSDATHIMVSNTLQRKALPEPSTGTGLDNIRKRYALVTDVPVFAGEVNGSFVVRLPLL